MVKGKIIRYHLKNGKALDYSSFHEADCIVMNNGECFHGIISESHIEMDFPKINSYHFADK